MKGHHNNKRARKPGRTGLTDRLRKVVDEYFANGFNQAKAMAAAGYKHPNVYSPRIFRHPAVVAEIERRRAKIAEKHDITQERIMAELAKMAFSNLGDLIEVDDEGRGWVDLRKLTDDQRGALAEFTTEEFKQGRGEDGRDVLKYRVKFHDKLGALNSLARILGIFNDKLKLENGEDLAARLQRGRQRVAKGEA